jgi:hypothetical protein
MLESFNNRELAILAWLVNLLIWMITQQSTRQSMLGLIRSMFVWKLSVIWAIMLGYTASMVYGLYKLSLWDSSQLKNTILWFFTVGLATLFDVTNKDKQNYFKIAVKDIFKFTAIFEFIISVYSFSFIVELLLVPAVIFLIFLIAVGERESKYSTVVKIFNTCLSIIGIFLIGYTLNKIIFNFQSFANKGTLNDFLIPIVLSFLFLPLIYLVSLYVSHDDTFTGLNRIFRDRKLLRYAKIQTLFHFGFRKNDLQRWRSIVNLREFRSKDGIDNSISVIKELRETEKNPPEVPFKVGWSPYAAKEFLSTCGIETRYYHPSFGDDVWSASSSYIKIKESSYLDTISYYVEGSRSVVKEIKLVLDVHSSEGAAISHLKFIEFANVLSQSAINKPVPPIIEKAIKKGTNQVSSAGNRSLSVVVNKWIEHPRRGYTLELRIEVL